MVAGSHAALAIPPPASPPVPASFGEDTENIQICRVYCPEFENFCTLTKSVIPAPLAFVPFVVTLSYDVEFDEPPL